MAAAIIASTLTTVSVFLPLVFTNGTVRDLMLPMSLSVMFCLGSSLLIALTVAPAAASTLLKHSRAVAHPRFDRMKESYGRALDWCLGHKFISLASCGALFALAAFLVLRLGVVVVPEVTANQLMVTVTMEEGLNKEEAYATADRLMERLDALPGTESVGAMSGGTAGMMVSSFDGADDYQNFVFLINLQDKNPDGEQVRALAASIETENADLPCEITASANAVSMSEMMGSGLQIQIYGDDLQTLERCSQEVMEIVDGVEGFENISNGQEEGEAVLHLHLDKDEVRRLGLTVAQVYQDINAKLSDSAVSAQVTVDDATMDVVVKDDRQPLTKENLSQYSFRVTVTDEDGDQVLEDHLLQEFATVTEETGMAAINRENQNRYITVSAETGEGYNLALLSRQLQPL